MNDDLAIDEENPYRSPRYDWERSAGRKQIRYRSALQAIRAGSWRGAKFGAKWVGLFLGGLAFILCAFVGVRLYFHIYQHGIDVRYALEALFILCRFFLFTLILTFMTAVVSAILMGSGEWVAYWQSGQKPAGSQ
jgi:hypothetical protein